MSHIKTQSALLKVIGVAIVFFPTITIGQAQLRLIDKTTWRSEPVRIQKLRAADGKVIELGKRFSAEGEWLKGLTVTVENVSTKAIARIELNLAFPRSPGISAEVSTYMVPLIYGLDPSDPSYTELQKTALPGDAVELHLPDVNLPTIRADLKNLGYAEDIWHVQIRIESVTFLDGSTWAGDEILFPDPKNPSRKINPRLQRQNTNPDPLMSYEMARRGESPRWRFQKANFASDSAFSFYAGGFSLRSL